MISEVARRFRALTPEQRVRWASVAPLGLASAALEGAGGAVVFALLALLLDPVHAADGRLAAFVREQLPRPDSSSTLVALAALAAAIHISRSVLLALFAWWRARCVALDTAALSTRLLQGYVDAPWAFHLQRSSAALMETIRGSARPYFEVFESASSALTEMAVVAALGLVAVAVAPAAVTATAVVVAVLVSVIVRLARRAQGRGGERSTELGAALNRHVQHSLGAAKEIGILGRGQFFVDAFARDAHAAARLDTRRALLDALPRLLLESAFVLGMLGLVIAGTATGSPASMLPIVSLYAYAGFRAIPAAHRIAVQISNLRWNLGASAALFEDLSGSDAAPSPVRHHTPRLPFNDSLKAQHISFAYDGAATAVLEDVSLTIRHGESVAIAGPTGAGKTTLVDVLIGLLTPSAGRILVDDQPVAGHVAAWQQNVGYVPQTAFLLDDTLRRNIALGLPDEAIDERAVTEAVRLSRLEDMVRRLPQGLDTMVGERGIRLSGGERQRVSIARALYGNPSLVVFDEATSSLDPGTERDIADAIEPLRGTRTVIVIAHRLTTIERCDRVLLLNGGRIEAVGTYPELSATNTAFRAMAAL